MAVWAQSTFPRQPVHYFNFMPFRAPTFEKIDEIVFLVIAQISSAPARLAAARRIAVTAAMFAGAPAQRATTNPGCHARPVRRFASARVPEATKLNPDGRARCQFSLLFLARTHRPVTGGPTTGRRRTARQERKRPVPAPARPSPCHSCRYAPSEVR